MPARATSLKALDSLGSASIGYTLADLITSVIEHFYPAIFFSEKFTNSFYAITVMGCVVFLRVMAAKLEEWQILKLEGDNNGGAVTT